MWDWQKAEQIANKARSSQPWRHNTKVEYRDNDTIAVKLHSTDVVLVHRDGRYTLNSGGYYTKITKTRINQIVPCYVFQRQGEWFVGQMGKEDKHFFDGIEVTQ